MPYTYSSLSIEKAELYSEGLHITYKSDLNEIGIAKCHLNSKICFKKPANLSQDECIFKNPVLEAKNKLTCTIESKNNTYSIEKELSLSGKIEKVFHEITEGGEINKPFSINCVVKNTGDLNFFSDTSNIYSISAELGFIAKNLSSKSKVSSNLANIMPGDATTLGKTFFVPEGIENIEIFCTNLTFYNVMLDGSYINAIVKLPKEKKFEEKFLFGAIVITFIVVLLSMFLILKTVKRPITSEKVLKDEERLRIMQQMEARIAELEVKKEVLESYRAEAHKKYYNGQINEKMFKELLEKYQKEKADIESEISALRRKIDRISKHNL
jgi:hypothetical protein